MPDPPEKDNKMVNTAQNPLSPKTPGPGSTPRDNNLEGDVQAPTTQ